MNQALGLRETGFTGGIVVEKLDLGAKVLFIMVPDSRAEALLHPKPELSRNCGATPLPQIYKQSFRLAHINQRDQMSCP